MLLALLVLALAVAGGCENGNGGLRSTDVTGAQFGRDFELVDHTGKPRRLGDFHGKVVVVFFGFTHCPDVCPTTLAELKVTMPNDLNNGIEALTACLASRTKGDPLLTIRDDQFVNADNDRASKNITNWYFGDYELREISDAFGYSMAYMHWKDYEKANPGTRRIRVDPSSSEMTFDPQKSPNTKAFLRPTKFQILSVGPDGKPGTPDEVLP